MKYRKRGPCRHFDLKTDSAKPSAKCYGTVACYWYMENATADEIKNDPQAPCKRREEIGEDTQTVDMFEEGN